MLSSILFQIKKKNPFSRRNFPIFISLSHPFHQKLPIERKCLDASIASSMSLSLRNRSAPFNSKKCYDRRTFRATAKFHGKVMWDCAKFAVEGFDSSVRIFFGRCLAFFRDDQGAHYIALRWFEACHGDHNVIDPIVQMPRLQEACITAPTSYGVMPVSALLNGALLIPSGDLFYAFQSLREQDVYFPRNS